MIVLGIVTVSVYNTFGGKLPINQLLHTTVGDCYYDQRDMVEDVKNAFFPLI